MKVLFICRQNAGRSQFAEAFYNQLTGSNDADSAGTQVDIPGQTLEDRWKAGGAYAVPVMDEKGIDARSQQTKQLTQHMLTKYDRIVRIVRDEHCPDWLLDYKGVLSWDIDDPKGLGLEATRHARDLVERKVKELVE